MFGNRFVGFITFTQPVWGEAEACCDWRDRCHTQWRAVLVVHRNKNRDKTDSWCRIVWTVRYWSGCCVSPSTLGETRSLRRCVSRWWLRISDLTLSIRIGRSARLPRANLIETCFTLSKCASTASIIRAWTVMEAPAGGSYYFRNTITSTDRINRSMGDHWLRGSLTRRCPLCLPTGWPSLFGLLASQGSAEAPRTPSDYWSVHRRDQLTHPGPSHLYLLFSDLLVSNPPRNRGPGRGGIWTGVRWDSVHTDRSSQSDRHSRRTYQAL